MRFIFKILLGLIIFNAMLVIFSGIFTYESTGVNGSDVTHSADYNKFEGLNVADFFKDFILITSGVFAFALVVGLLTNTPTNLIIGASSVVALIAGLWGTLSQPFSEFMEGYSYLPDIYNVFIICIGVISVMSVIEIFTGKGDVD